MTDLTDELNINNVAMVRSLIKQKQSNTPLFATQEMAMNTITDYDHFPYTRAYRGVYYSTKPIAMEREAGFRVRHDNCYKTIQPPYTRSTFKKYYPNHCFQASCSTVYPCIPSYMVKYSDKEALDVQLNNACITQYR